MNENVEIVWRSIECEEWKMGAVAVVRVNGLIGQVWDAPPPRHANRISTPRYTHFAAGNRYASG